MHWIEAPVSLILTDDPNRPSGLHVSQIIGDLLKSLYPDVYGKPLHVEKITTGQDFEQVLEQGFKKTQGSIFRPEPIKLDGIWMSPDGICPDPWRVEEYKLTWYSLRTWDLTDKRAWGWLVQMRAYCHALETCEARLTVMFVNGDYQPPKPCLKQYLLTFTELELQENWMMLVNHAKAKGWL